MLRVIDHRQSFLSGLVEAHERCAHFGVEMQDRHRRGMT
jgi:hypothetical protein